MSEKEVLIVICEHLNQNHAFKIIVIIEKFLKIAKRVLYVEKNKSVKIFFVIKRVQKQITLNKKIFYDKNELKLMICLLNK